MAPDETEIRLIIDVVVIGEITCRYQSFTLILLQLDVEAPVSQPCDDAREGLTQRGIMYSTCLYLIEERSALAATLSISEAWSH